MEKRKCQQLLSARQVLSAVFQRVKSYFIQFKTNQLPETGRIMPWLRLFCVCRKGGGLILKS